MKSTRAFPWADVCKAYDRKESGVLKTVYKGPWEQDGKSQWQEVVFQAADTGKFYAFYVTRTGSPFTDWYYDQFEYHPEDTEKLDEVSKVEKVVYSWEPVEG